MRRLTRRRFASLVACGVAAGLLAPAVAPLAAQEAGQATFGGLEQRPAAAPLQVPAADPALDAFLAAWHAKTQQIRKLEGEHYRWIYDLTFNVEMRSSGNFYYEAPDKGRIDIEPTDPRTDKISPAPGFVLKADRPQKWICDGQQILQINTSEKTFESIPIPPQHQGANIMDGPLPFLFGMPPEKAKQRYNMTIVGRQDGRVFLKVLPRTQSDAANWQKADVILAEATFLPEAVQLLDPSGNKRTAYKFKDVTANKMGLLPDWLGGNPFRPNLAGYKMAQVAPVQQAAAQGVPSVIGLNYKQAETVLKARGYVMQCVRGPAANRPELVYVVKSQFPAPDAAAEPGATVTLTLYTDPAQPAAGAAPTQSAARP